MDLTSNNKWSNLLLLPAKLIRFWSCHKKNMTKLQFPRIFPLPFTKITSNNQGYGVGARTIEGQNTFGPALCFA